MLLVGIDWAESEHAACLLDPAGAVLRRLKVPHTVAGVRRLVVAIAERERQPSAVLLGIERPDGLLVEALLEDGNTLYAPNPRAVDRYRDRTRSAGARTDPVDAELLARILLTDRDRHLPLLPSRPEVAAIRAIARDDERARRDQRRLLNRLRQDLLTVFPQTLEAFSDLSASTALAFLARWPTAAHAQLVGPDELAAFLREQRHGWPQRSAVTIRAALAAEALAASTSLAQAGNNESLPR